MSATYKSLLAIGITLGALMLSGPSLAQKDQGGGKHDNSQKHGKGDKHGGNDKHGKADKGDKGDKIGGGSGDKGRPTVGAVFSDSHRDEARRYYASERSSGKGCPPGLAKKGNGCQPPGQAKFKPGQALPSTVTYYPVPSSLVVRLPPVPVGHQYVRVGVDIVLLALTGRLVVDVLPGVLVF